MREIFTSAGKPTVEVGVVVKSHAFLAQIPSGESRGGREAAVLSMAEAQTGWRSIQTRVIGADFKYLKEWDGFLLRLDGTPDKSKLGGNIILGLSLAFARALAFSENKELWQVLREEFFAGEKEGVKPLIFANLIEGGVHAQDNLALQEYMVVKEMGDSSAKSVEELVNLYKKLGENLRRKNKLENIPLGTEGGYMLDFKDDFEPLAVLSGMVQDENLALDAAANSFHKDGKYVVDEKKMSAAELAEVYAGYFAKEPKLISIEDPFAENDVAGFQLLRERLPDKWIVGDDLTVTNPDLIKKYAQAGAINAVIIKANQIGSLSEACAAMKLAKELGLKRIVSHRGEETEDVFLVHLAKAGNAEAVKIGAPARERILKYDEVLRLYP